MKMERLEMQTLTKVREKWSGVSGVELSGHLSYGEREMWREQRRHGGIRPPAMRYDAMRDVKGWVGCRGARLRGRRPERKVPRQWNPKPNFCGIWITRLNSSSPPPACHATHPNTTYTPHDPHPITVLLGTIHLILTQICNHKCIFALKGVVGLYLQFHPYSYNSRQNFSRLK